MRRWFATVRVRTTVFATLVVAIALVSGAVVLLVVQHRSLVTGLDQRARARASDVATLARRNALPTTLTATREEAVFTQVVDRTGRVLAASKNLRDEPRVLDLEPTRKATVLVTRSIGHLGGRFRVAVRTVATPTGAVTVYAGDTVTTADNATRQLATLLVVGLPLLVGLVGLVTWRVTGRALRPVESIRAEVARIEETDLHRRVPEPPTKDEIGRLARTMNAMLGRLDQAADRQRRFISDASHELQSPLTSLRARFEVDLASTGDPGWRQSETEALEEITEMQRLIDDLLTLARYDARVEVQAHEPVDLDDIVLREADRLRARGRVDVDTSRVSVGPVVGDRDQLRRAIRNMLDNAERHAAGRVSVAVRESGGEVEVRVADDGAGVPVEHRDRIFERFARIDDARTRTDGSTGLGLAITREIAEAHGGHICVETGAPGACFVLRLPAGVADQVPPARPRGARSASLPE